MPIYSKATFERIDNHSDGPFKLPILGVILHVNDGQPSPTDSNIDLYHYIITNPGAACPHFQVGKAGKVWQYVDTSNTSWCQSDGNAQYLSIETQGLPTEPATQQQIDSINGILLWLNKIHNIPLKLADKPGDTGFGWHGMGGDAWGGHPNCPGIRKDQRTLMLATSPPSPPEDDMEPAIRLVTDPRNNVWALYPFIGKFHQVYVDSAAGAVQYDVNAFKGIGAMYDPANRITDAQLAILNAAFPTS